MTTDCNIYIRLDREEAISIYANYMVKMEKKYENFDLQSQSRFLYEI